MLYKLFHSKDLCKRHHNHELLDLEHDLLEDKRFSLLSRQFIQGNHKPRQLSDFFGAVKKYYNY